jgi:hypothetical protein
VHNSLSQVKNEVKRLRAKAVFIATDYNDLKAELSQVLKNVSHISQFPWFENQSLFSILLTKISYSAINTHVDIPDRFMNIAIRFSDSTPPYSFSLSSTCVCHASFHRSVS